MAAYAHLLGSGASRFLAFAFCVRSLRMSDQSDDSKNDSTENDVDMDLMGWDDRGADDDREIGGEH